MKSPAELAQEGRVKEAFDNILTGAKAAAKHDPEEVAKIFEEALRGMPPTMQKVIRGLSNDMKVKFVQKAMRGLKGAALAFDTILTQELPLSALALPPEELAKRGLFKEAYEQMLSGGGQGKGKGRGKGKGQGRGQGGQGHGGQGKGCDKGRDGQGRGGQGQGPPPDATPEELGEQGLFTAAYEAILTADCDGECKSKCDDPVELAQKGQSKATFEAVLAAPDPRLASVREADNAFQKELLPRLFEPVLERAINDIQGLFHDIDDGKWPNNQIEYAVMRYKPLSMTDEEFIEALYDPYSKWLNKVRP